MTAWRCLGGSASSAARSASPSSGGGGSVVATSGSSPVGRARRAVPRSWSIALRWAIVTSQPRTLLSGRSRGYARSADRNVSDQASSASAGPSSARHTRITTGPCSWTISSNGRTVP